MKIFLKKSWLLILFTVFLMACNSIPNKTEKNANSIPSPNLLKSLEILPDLSCNKTLELVQAEWNEQAFTYKEYFTTQTEAAKTTNCYWTRLSFQNEDAKAKLRVLYFHKGWHELECYIQHPEGDFEKKVIGTKTPQEVLFLLVPPEETLNIYVKYPNKNKSIVQRWDVWEMSEGQYQSLNSRTIYKFLFFGVVLFPLLFFLVQVIVEKDKLSFYYFIFLFGAAVNLLTMLETIPFFALNPKMIASIGILARLFVFSIFLTMFGLVKYVHCLLDVSSWSSSSFKTGNILLWGFGIFALIPMIYYPIFSAENYPAYLLYFRIFPLLALLYVLIVCVWALFKKIKFSRILMLAFSPFILAAIYYAVSFIALNNYSKNSLSSLILIIAFLLTLFLFGLIVGLRNNAVKADKIKLEQNTERLRELDQFKSRFYTNITHEFRTPLTVIKGMAEQISNQEKVKELIQRNSERLMIMVDQLLNLSRLENNRLAINWVNGNIIPYLKYLTESCHSLAEDKQLNLSFFSAEENLVMDYDEIKIQQIVLNLLSNAIKFTPEYGSVKVMVSKKASKNNSLLQLRVEDTGYGIPEDKIPHIFDRFYQVDNSGTRREEGTGIGLALVKELIQLMKGSIEVSSDLDRGTTFTLYLPIHDLAVGSSPSSFSSQKQIKTSSSKEIKISSERTSNKDEKPLVLIIEDNRDVAEYIMSCLQQDYELSYARNGKKGLEEAIKIIPDVIICDVMMPEMDGFEVCRRLKSDQRTSHIPIIMLTAKSTPEDRKTGLSQGADAYLIKPFDKEELLIRLHNLSLQSRLLKERLSLLPQPTEELSPLEKQEALFLQEIHQIIDKNMQDEQFDTLFLCKKAAMSRTQLHRKLKALTGQSTANYIRSVRLKKAKHLLENTTLPIGEIAFEIGFKDFSHFSRSFQKEFGGKPSEIRND